jgi:hypothetical protein
LMVMPDVDAGTWTLVHAPAVEGRCRVESGCRAGRTAAQLLGVRPSPTPGFAQLRLTLPHPWCLQWWRCTWHPGSGAAILTGANLGPAPWQWRSSCSCVLGWWLRSG